MKEKDFPVRAKAFFLSSEKRASSAPMSAAGTLCFDIFSPPPGDSDVISQVERLSSNETKIAPRSLRMALGASGRSAIICKAVSRVGGRNLTLPECRSLSTSPWDLEPRRRIDRRHNGHREGRSPSALPQPHDVRAGLSAREPGDGLRRA